MPERLTIDRVDLSWSVVDGSSHLSDLVTVHGRRILEDRTEEPWLRAVLVKGQDYAALYTWLNRVGLGVAGPTASEVAKDGRP